MKNNFKKPLFGLTAIFTAFLAAACAPVSEDEQASGGASDDQVVIFTNADEEPANIIQETLNSNGFEGEYVLQSFGTSELGGKLMAEGADTEADLVTMSTFYLTSAQEANEMFQSLELPTQPLGNTEDFVAPMTGQEGVMFYNSQAIEDAGLELPTSLKDLADDQYAGQITIPDINHSSTAWLLFQALIDTYGEGEAQTILKGIYENAGNLIEQSGSGPLQKVQSGEAAIGFGLRHQALAANEDSDLIQVIEPEEGSYVLTESFALLDKGENSNPKAQEMLDILVEQARPEIQKLYPTPLYEGEESTSSEESKTFSEPLTAELLEGHKALVD